MSPRSTEKIRAILTAAWLVGASALVACANEEPDRADVADVRPTSLEDETVVAALHGEAPAPVAPMAIGGGPAEEPAGGADCVTEDGAPYEAERCGGVR